MDKKKQIKLYALAGVCMLAVGFMPNWEKQIKQLDKLQVLGTHTVAVSDVNAAPELAAIADNPVLTARAALAYDYSSGSILYTLNFDQELPVASLTKLVSALVIVDSGKLDEVVTVQEDDIKIIGANTGLVIGEKILASNLLKAMLIASHNDSTRTLARVAGGTRENFVKLMHEKALNLGMYSTNFKNPIGLDEPGHYSTAHDLTLALHEFLSNPLLAKIVSTKETEITSIDGIFKHKIKTTNKLLLEDPTVVGVKTGYTDEAKGNLVIRSVDGNSDIVTIVLGSDDREGDTRKILDWTRTVYRW